MYIRCPNPQCPAQLKERIRYFASRGAMDIEGLGDELVDKLVSEGLVRSYGDLYRLRSENLLKLKWESPWGLSLAEKIVEGIEDTKQYDVAWFLQALFLWPLSNKVRRRRAKQLAGKFSSVDEITGASVEEIARVPCIGSVFAKEIYECLHQDTRAETMGELEVQECRLVRNPARVHRGIPERLKNVISPATLISMV